MTTHAPADTQSSALHEELSRLRHRRLDLMFGHHGHGLDRARAEREQHEADVREREILVQLGDVRAVARHDAAVADEATLR